MSKDDFIKQVATIMTIVEYSEYIKEYKQDKPNVEYKMRMSEHAIRASKEFARCYQFVKNNYDIALEDIDSDFINKFNLEKKNQ